MYHSLLLALLQIHNNQYNQSIKLHLIGNLLHLLRKVFHLSHISSFLEIRIIDNREGLQKINENMKNKSVTASIGIVERALNQMEEYDFLVIIILFYHK